ncbi:MAG: YjbQ family protein [Candidatus Wallbacteria bacterium]|nr:YjbQ family protein [Candidatus Wallbacteria bacterium]
MMHFQKSLSLPTQRQGLHDITGIVSETVSSSHVRLGLCTLFIRHTSASLLIQENADPTARGDLERFLARLVPEGDPLFRHVAEGPDDMPAHVRSALTQTSLAIPVTLGRLALGTWQGIYLWEHRRNGSAREVLVHVNGEDWESAGD